MAPAAATVAPLEAALKAEAGKFAAEEAARQAKEPGASSGPTAGAPPSPQVDAAMTANLIVTLLDLVLASFVSQKLKLNDAEAAVICAKAEPVVRLYLPPELFLGPVGALAATAGAIYAAKLMAPDEAPPAGEQTVDSTATATTPPGAPGVPT